MKIWPTLIHILWFIFLTSAVSAQTFTSTDKRVNVLELYTSEGCSSCPPADQWFSQLKQDKRLWKEIIPMAFHVDYWDYIGWKDRFANKTYAQRQRQYAQQKQVQVVYTPAMLLNGKEWRQWYKLKPLNLDNTKNHGKLSIEIKGKRLDASYIPISKTDKSLLLNIAILGFNLTSEIKEGENKGRTLKHDFVVLAHKIISLEQNESHYGINNVELPKVSIMDKQTAIVVWVNTEQNLTPLQATGGWMLDKLSHSDLKWSRPEESKIQKMLTHEQYTITQHEGTETPFRNAYWDHKAEGIYVDIVSGEPLFSSTNKFTSGTGWPSFTRPLVKQHIVEKVDWSMGYERIEVRSFYANSHLGHVFKDDPGDLGWRYCINSAALKFIPKQDLEKQGYSEFTGIFEN